MPRRPKPKIIVVVSSPTRTRGCARVAPSFQRGDEEADMVIAIASPARFDLRRLARVFEHEYLHTAGYEHEDMEEDDMYSLGPVPRWAQGVRLRYVRRAPSQLPG